MGSTSASVSGTADAVELDNVKLDARTQFEWAGLEQAMRTAVESVIQNDATVKAKIAAAVKQQIINVHKAAKANNKPWPFPPS